MKSNRTVVYATLITGVVFLVTTITLVSLFNTKECSEKENGKVCESKAIDSSGNLRVSVCNSSLVDIRLFVLKDKRYEPTIKGINLQSDQWRELIKLTSWIQCHLNQEKDEKTQPS
jgi:hypothetical protein